MTLFQQLIYIERIIEMMLCHHLTYDKDLDQNFLIRQVIRTTKLLGAQNINWIYIKDF